MNEAYILGEEEFFDDEEENVRPDYDANHEENEAYYVGEEGFADDEENTVQPGHDAGPRDEDLSMGTQALQELSSRQRKLEEGLETMSELLKNIERTQRQLLERISVAPGLESAQPDSLECSRPSIKQRARGYRKAGEAKALAVSS